MGRSEWRFTERATIDASPEAIVEWWFHLDRRHEFLKRLEGAGATDISVDWSIAEDGVLIRDSNYTNRHGLHSNHHSESRLTPNGMAEHDGEQFLVSFTSIGTFRSPAGNESTLNCDGRAEFRAELSGRTVVTFIHHHVLMGGGWFHRWSFRQEERTNTQRVFKDTVTRCQAALGHRSG